MPVRMLRAALAAAASMAVLGGVAQGAAAVRAPAPVQVQRATLDSSDFGASFTSLNGLTLQAGRDASSANGVTLDNGPGSTLLLPNAKAALSPYDSMTDGGSFVSAAIRLASNLSFQIGASTLSAEQRLAQSPQAVSRVLIEGGVLPRQSQGSEAGFTWNAAPWATLGLTASQASEHASPLGGGVPVSASVAGGGVNARVGLGAGWVTTFSYREGVAQLMPGAAPATSFGTRSYGLAVAKRGLFSAHDALALAVTRPGQFYNGTIDLDAPTGVDLTRSLIGPKANLTPGVAETDVEVGYVTTFFGGTLALQANAQYQMNVAGQNGNNSVSVLSRAKINF